MIIVTFHDNDLTPKGSIIYYHKGGGGGLGSWSLWTEDIILGDKKGETQKIIPLDKGGTEEFHKKDFLGFILRLY